MKDKLKVYVVTLENNIDYDDFYKDMEAITANHPYVPDRVVGMANELPYSERNTHYYLTPEEADKLSQDPRVLAVEIPPEQRDDIEIGHWAKQFSDFRKTYTQGNGNWSTGSFVNYALVRASTSTNIYSNTTVTSVTSYDYHLDGTGVDVVIQDSGLQIDHPEFFDVNGNSRVQPIDWYTAAGLYTPGPLNLKTSTNSRISSNSYITFGSIANSYNNFTPSNIGGALVLGAVDASVDRLYSGTEDSGRSYRVRYEGNSSYTQTNQGSLKWEVRFLDNNWIEILMLRHDNATTGVWALQSSTSVITNLGLFNTTALVGSSATSISCVLTTANSGTTWTINGGINTTTSYYATLTGSVWTLSPGVASEKRVASLSTVTNTYADDSLYSYTTPFDFYPGVYSSSSQSRNHYRDYDGHGTHVAGTVAGRTFGWAKNAQVYSVKVSGLEGSGDSGTGISITDCFNVIKLWHRNKPVDPVTGRKRPTIVNMSWGYGTSQVDPTSGNYRGTPWTYGVGSAATRALCYSNFGLVNGGNGRWSVRVASVDADVDALAAEGVIVCIAAGNNYDKQDVVGGSDYNNYAVTAGGTVYYHRGSSPHSTATISVGCIDDTVNSGDLLEQAVYFSTKGPGVDIWSWGRHILSCTSQTNSWNGPTYHYANYYLDPTFKQVNLSGTSMASPNAAGVVALFMQLNPGATPAEAKDFLQKNSKSVLHSTGLDNDYTNTNSLIGAQNRVIYWPFSADVGFKFTAGLQ